MSKYFLTFGSVNKKTLIPFLLALWKLLYNIFELFYPGNKNQIIESYSTSIGHMLILIIPKIMLFSANEKQFTSKIGLMNKTCSKKNFCHYFGLIILYNMETISLFISIMLDKKNSHLKLPHEHGPFTRESFTIIFIVFISFFFLKYKYYSHNIISLIIFIIMSILMDLILDNFAEEYANRDYNIVIIFFIVIIFEVINFCYQKYMIDKLYHFYYNVVFALGLDLFICNSIALGYVLTNEEYKKSLIDNFDNLGLLIPRFFIIMIFQFVYFLLRILTLVYFTPTHLLICLSLSKFLVSLIDKESSLKYLSIIPFIFQFFSLMIFLEIIELNFGGLNKNTKRNIAIREEQDRLLGEDSRNSIMSLTDSEVEYTPGYYCYTPSADYKNDIKESIEKESPIIEMKAQSDNVDEK